MIPCRAIAHNMGNLRVTPQIYASGLGWRYTRDSPEPCRSPSEAEQHHSASRAAGAIPHSLRTFGLSVRPRGRTENACRAPNTLMRSPKIEQRLAELQKEHREALSQGDLGKIN